MVNEWALNELPQPDPISHILFIQIIANIGRNKEYPRAIHCNEKMLTLVIGSFLDFCSWKMIFPLSIDNRRKGIKAKKIDLDHPR